MNRTVRVVAVALGAAACGRGRDARAEWVRDSALAVRPRNCPAETTDSARTVCVALEVLDRDGMARRPSHLFRHGDTTCVVAWPTSPDVVDGEGMAEVVHGIVVNSMLSDSVGCPGEPPE